MKESISGSDWNCTFDLYLCITFSAPTLTNFMKILFEGFYDVKIKLLHCFKYDDMQH